MAKLDPRLKKILEQYHPDPKNAVWDCRGKWVAYHKDLEIVATAAGITFDPPQIIETDINNKAACVCVVGHMGDQTEWSFGESAPYNTTNQYPFSMAEKRAKDRVILKLVGLSGFIYSDQEADEWKAEGEKRPEADKNLKAFNIHLDPKDTIDKIYTEAVELVGKGVKGWKAQIKQDWKMELATLEKNSPHYYTRIRDKINQLYADNVSREAKGE